MDLSGKAFLVSGGASGLGEAVVRRLVAAGGRVVIADINQEAGEAVRDSLGEAAEFAPTDVRLEDSVRTAIQTAVQAFGALHGAVSCAGVGPPAKVLGKEGPHSLDLFERVIQVNLIGTFNVLRLSAEAMSGNDSDDGGERGAYSASKCGVVGLTLPSARELARHGIRVVTIAPGIFDTPLLAGLPDKARQSLGEQVPFPSRLGRPDEYAALVQHIVENAMINGEIIRLDGALRMAPR